MPAAIDPAVAAAEHEGDAWWVVLRDVGPAVPTRTRRSPATRTAACCAPPTRCGRSSGASATTSSATLAHASRSPDRRSPSSSATRVDLLPKQFEAAWERSPRRSRTTSRSRSSRCWMTPPRCLQARVARHDAASRRLQRRAHRLRRRHADRARLGRRDTGPSGPGPRLVHGPRCVADRGHTQRSRRGLSPRRGESTTTRGQSISRGCPGSIMYGRIFGLCAVIHTYPAERRWAREELAWRVPRARHSLETWSP